MPSIIHFIFVILNFQPFLIVNTRQRTAHRIELDYTYPQLSYLHFRNLWVQKGIKLTVALISIPNLMACHQPCQLVLFISLYQRFYRISCGNCNSTSATVDGGWRIDAILICFGWWKRKPRML